MTEFIKYIDTFNHELVSDSDMIASFIDSNDFEKFKWD